MKNLFAASAAAVALSFAAAAVPAVAAPGPGLPIVGSPTSISAGVFLPSSSESKGGGNTQLSVTFNYPLPVPSVTDTSRTIISLGVETGTKGGKHNTIIPLTVGQIVSLNGGDPNAGGQAYGGLGLGAYFLNQSGLSSSAKIGGYGQLGYNFTSNLFVDARYQLVSHANGFVVNLGTRF